VALAGTAVIALPSVRARLGWIVADGPSYPVGTTLDIAPSVFASAPHTVIFFSSVNCGACDRSRHVFSEIVEDVRGTSGLDVRLVHPETFPEDQRAFATTIGLRDGEVAVTAFDTLRLRHIPTTVVVDRRGAVLYAHEGVLSEADRVDIQNSGRSSDR
jgi:hypothetical protein